VATDLGKLVEQHGQNNLTVQLVGGIVFERVGDTERALEVLSKHEGSLDAYVPPSSHSTAIDVPIIGGFRHCELVC
jgi:hypothetical protein